jgi:hypothetical protein
VNEKPIPIEDISAGLRAALAEAEAMEILHSKPAARCKLTDGREYLAWFTNDRKSVWIERSPLGRVGLPQPEPAGAEWEPCPQVFPPESKRRR